MTYQALTANRLRDGRIVYLDGEGRWSEAIRDSGLALDDDEAAALVRIADAAARKQEIVGPYLIAVRSDNDGIAPLGQRERIRARGPSIPSDFTESKQS